VQRDCLRQSMVHTPAARGILLQILRHRHIAILERQAG
jgi:hypothetical protein